MAKKNPKRDAVERILKEQPKRKSFLVAQDTELDKEMGTEKAVNYIRGVRKSMRRKDELPRINREQFFSDEERLEDIITLFEVRKGKMSIQAARTMLLLNCYYRLRSEDDNIHAGAIESTYNLNYQLKNQVPLNEAISLCEMALKWYMASIDEEKNREAIEKGYPGSGLNYTSESLRTKCEITAEELPFLKTIQRPQEQ